MRDNVFIKFTGESDLSQIEGELQKLRDREKEIKSELSKINDVYSKEVISIKESIKGRQKQQEAIEKVRSASERNANALRSELKQTKNSIQQFADKLSKVNDTTVKGATSTPRLTTQLRLLKEEMAQLEMQGVAPTDKAFMSLAVKTAKLEDQMSNTQARVKYLASDTKNLDAVMGAGQGLAGAFSVATSSMALLGGESEELQKAFFKVQSTLQILNGVQMVADSLNKDGALRVVYGTAVQEKYTKAKKFFTKSVKAETVATKSSTIATKGFGLALKGIGIGLIVSALAWLVTNWEKVTEVANRFLPTGKKVGDMFDKIKSMAMGVGTAIINYVAMPIKALTKVITGDFKGAYAEIKNGISIIDNYKKGYQKQEVRNTEKHLNEQERKEIEANKRAIERAENQGRDMYEQKLANGKRELALMKKEGKDTEEKQKELEDLQDKHLAEISSKRKQAYEKRLADKKKRQEDIKKSEEDLQMLLVEMMKEGKEKELETLKLEHKGKLATIKGNSESEKELRAMLVKEYEQNQQKINDKYAQIDEKNAKALLVLKKKNQLALNKEDIELQKEYLRIVAEQKILEIEQSTEKEEVKAEKIKAVNIQLNEDLEKINEKGIKNRLALQEFETEKTLENEEYLAQKVLESNKSSISEKIKAERTLHQLKYKALDNEAKLIDTQYKKGLIDKAGYEQKMFDLTKQRHQLEVDDLKAKSEREKEILNTAINTATELTNIGFDMKKEKLNAEMESIEQNYISQSEWEKMSAEDKLKNADKELVSDEMLSKKKLELKRKQARLDKEQALFNIAVSTAQAVMSIWAQVPKMDFGVMAGILTASTIALGVAQAAAVASKPLPKYAKGRKGGQGEFAIVGEQGSEVVWLPDGASVFPHGKKLTPDVLNDYGVPIPTVNDKAIQTAVLNAQLNIDYNKLGKAVADNISIPKYERSKVNINIDREGVRVDDGVLDRTVLNDKYVNSF